MQTTQEVNPHPRIAPCVDMWSAIFFFLCHLMNVGAPHHTIKMLHFVLFYSVTCYTNSKASRIHVNTTKPHYITCTLVDTGVILRSLECMCKVRCLGPHVDKGHFIDKAVGHDHSIALQAL